MTRAEMLAVFQHVLDQHPEVGPVDLDRLRITDNVVTEAQDGKKPLSEAILDSCFPRADTKVEYAHYTPFQTLKGIVAAGQWRLYWVFKRLHKHGFPRRSVRTTVLTATSRWIRPRATACLWICVGTCFTPRSPGCPP